MLQSSLAIAKIQLLGFIRNIKSNLFVFCLPIIFIGLFAIIFGAQPSEIQYDIGIYQQIESSNFDEYVTAITEVQNKEDESYFTVSNFDSQSELQEKIEDQELLLGVFITNDNIEILSNPFDSQSQAATGVLREVSDTYFKVSNDIVTYQSIISNPDEVSVFTYLVPGLFVYSLLNLLSQISNNLVTDVTQKYTFRYILARVKGWEVILGHTLSFIGIAVLQMILMFTASSLFGYQFNAQIIPLLITSLFTIGMIMGVGLCIGALAKNAEFASSVSIVLSVILGFVSGAFGTFPKIPIVGSITIVDLVPTYYATEAFRSVLQYNGSLQDIQFELFVLALSTVFFYVLGSILYSKFKLSKA